jgi:arylsulfatase A-like enzyme
MLWPASAPPAPLPLPRRRARIVLVLGLAALLGPSCGRPPPGDAPLILLISLDTTRADALGCTAAPDAVGVAPRLAGLAGEGVCFSRAWSSSSTTLAAHATVMTGLDSHGHGVVRNGAPVSPGVERLAERLGAAGWHAAAAVGSYALQRGMGLEQGFAAYEDHGGWRGLFGLYEVSADQVTDSALALLDARPAGAPTLLFAHYYDVHMPWNSAPDELQARFVPAGNPLRGDREGVGYLTRETKAGRLRPEDRAAARGLYLAELAWVDQQVGRLLDGLAARGLDDDLLVIVFADHGETFDEEPARPWGHGPDVDEPIIHVPLIIAGRGAFALPAGAPAVDGEQARLADLGTTALRLALGPGAPLGGGVDLSAPWRGEAVARPPSFAEATKPIERTRDDAWPNLPLERAVVTEGLLLTRAPYLGTPDALFEAAPGQAPVVDQPDRAAALGALLTAWDAAAPGPKAVELNEETRSALEALGYLDPAAPGAAP